MTRSLWRRQRARWRKTWQGQAGRRPKGAGPALEALEERAVPAVYNVTGTADTTPGQTGLITPTGPNTFNAASLRAAVEASDASSSTSADTINIPAGTYKLDNGALTIQQTTSHAVTLLGAAANTTVIDGQSKDRVIHILGSSNPLGPTNTPAQAAITTPNVTVSRLTIQHGSVNQGSQSDPDTFVFGGAGIDNYLGNLTVADSYITANTTVGLTGSGAAYGAGITSFGGNVSSQGSLTLLNSTVAGNQVTGGAGSSASGGGDGGSAFGGGILDLSFTNSTLTIENSTVSDNTATGGNATGSGHAGGFGGGGGLAVEISQAPLIVSSTFTQNRATGGTGSDNTSATQGGAEGGGINNFGTAVKVRSTLVAQDFVSGGTTGVGTSGPDVKGNFTSDGHNLIGIADSSSTGFTNNMNHDKVGSTSSPINALLAPLDNYGGPVPTHALFTGSPALNKGDDAVLGSPFNLATDERGFPRKVGTHVDVGAFESQARTDVTAQVGINRAGFVRKADTTDIFTQTLTLTNKGGKLTGPMQLVVNGLPAGDTLTAAAFIDPNTHQLVALDVSYGSGVPVVTIPHSVLASLDTGQKLSLSLAFRADSSSPLTYTAQLFDSVFDNGLPAPCTMC
jgi:hypothetical protein